MLRPWTRCAKHTAAPVQRVRAVGSAMMISADSEASCFAGLIHRRMHVSQSQQQLGFSSIRVTAMLCQSLNKTAAFSTHQPRVVRRRCGKSKGWIVVQILWFMQVSNVPFESTHMQAPRLHGSGVVMLHPTNWASASRPCSV